MDFDEYEYLEKMVENSEPDKSKGAANGADESVKSIEKDKSRSSRHRSDNDDLDHRSKRSKNGDDSRGSDRRRGRGSSRHRSPSRDLERSERDRNRHRSSREHRDREKEKDERNGRDRDRERGKDKDKDHERDRHRERKDRDGEKEKERDQDKDKEPDRERRSRSHSVRHRDEREKSRDMEIIEKDLREKDKESRRPKEKKEEAKEPEADPERDQRTVFAYQIALRADERDVYEFFSRAGKVRDVRLIMDRNSRRSKGVGYIEFYDAMSVPMAIALSGQPLFGQPVMVKPSEAEKNLVQSTASAAATGGSTGPYAGGGRRLYVGNLHYNITEVQLRQVFEAFGSVELVQLPLDETGHCKGFGFVQMSDLAAQKYSSFLIMNSLLEAGKLLLEWLAVKALQVLYGYLFARIEDAKAAETLNGQLEIAGRMIKVSVVTDQTGLQDGGKGTGDLDDDEGGGLALNAQSRALLMAKLDRSGTASSAGAGLSAQPAPNFVVPPGVSPLVAPFMQAPLAGLGGLPASALSIPPVAFPTIDTIGVPSECLLLKNMFDPAVEDDDFDLEIKEDVETESAKHGTLKHIFVDKQSAGCVYLRFDNTTSAISAQRALHGRYFAGKMITASFMVPQTYEAKFPESQ